MLNIEISSRFKKDIKRFQHDKKVQDKLEKIIETLIYEKKLPAKNKDMTCSETISDTGNVIFPPMSY